MNLIELLNRRYSTKQFDPNKKISDEDFRIIKELLHKSPSSTNLQPWHFIIAKTQSGKERIAEGTKSNYPFNRSKILNASVVVVFCSKTDLDEEYILKVTNQEEKDGRIDTPEVKEKILETKRFYSEKFKKELSDISKWHEKQVYLSMGFLLLGAATLGIDAVPMEGVDREAIDNEFGLKDKGYKSLAVVALGYHHDDDFNAKLPKSRLPEEEVITLLD